MINLHEIFGPGSNSLPIALKGLVILGFLFYLIDPESINSVFALFDCFGAILYELLIAGLIDLVYRSGAYEAFEGFLVNKGNGIYFSETEDESPNFEGNRDNIREQGI